MKTLDEVIKDFEKEAEEKEKDAKFYSMSRPDGYLKEYSAKKAYVNRQLSEWLKELKRLREQTKWIPVSERLPDVVDCYAVTRKTGSDLITSACYFDETGNWHNGNWINYERNYLTDIIAWAPLPKEPYKTKSEGEE